MDTFPLLLPLLIFILQSCIPINGRPTHYDDIDVANFNSDNMTTNIAATPTTPLIKGLVTTSFVGSMPAFLAEQSASLEFVDGNTCYTVKTLDHLEMGNLMARKTCWCLTVIEMPITATPTIEATATTTTVNITSMATPVFTTTITVFASSIVETVFETVQKPDEDVSTSSSRFSIESKTRTFRDGPSISGDQSSTMSDADDDGDVSTWIPENIISSSWPSNTIGIKPSSLSRWMQDSSKDLLSTTTMHLSTMKPWPSTSGMESSSSSSSEMSSFSIYSSMQDISSPHPSDFQSTHALTFTMTSNQEGATQTPSGSQHFISATASLPPTDGNSQIESTFSPRSGSSDSLDIGSEVTPIVSLFSDEVVARSSDFEDESDIVMMTSSPVYVSSTDTNTVDERVPALWTSRGPDSVSSPDASASLSESTEECDTPTMSLKLMSSSVEPSTSESTPCESSQDVHSSSFSAPNSSDVASIYGSGTPFVMPTNSLPFPIETSSYAETELHTSSQQQQEDISTLNPFGSDEVEPSVSRQQNEFSHIISPTLSSFMTTTIPPSLRTSPSVETSSNLPATSSSEVFTSEISQTPILDESTFISSNYFTNSPQGSSLSSSMNGIPESVSCTEISCISQQLPEDESTWTHRTKVTFVPTTTTMTTATLHVPTTTSTMKNTTEKPRSREHDTKFWIQTELRIPPGMNSTDTPTIVKNLAFLYERAYAHQYKRQRRFARAASIKLIHVRIDYKSRNMTIVYVLYYRGHLVPAEEAVKTIRIVRDIDMEKHLGHGVIVKAKPYEPWTSSAPLEGLEEPWHRAQLAWILVLVLLLFLLLLLIMLCCLCLRIRKRQKAEVKDAAVSSSFSQGEGRFSTTPSITMPGESIRSYRDAVTSPVRFGETGTYRRNESPKFYENDAFEGSVEELRKRRRPVLTQQTFEAAFERGSSGGEEARTELTPPEVKPRRKMKKTEKSAPPTNELSAYEDVRIPASQIKVRPIVSEHASDDEGNAPKEDIAETRRQLESMTERLNALVDNSLTIEDSRAKLYGSTRQRLLVQRKEYKNRSRSADSIDKYTTVSSIPSVSNPIYRDQPTQTLTVGQTTRKSTPPHFLVTIHKDIARTEQRIRHRQHQRAAESWTESTVVRGQYREPTAKVIEAIRHELDKAQDGSNRESFA